MCPLASGDDGLFDIVLSSSNSRLDNLKCLDRVYDGSHI